MISHTNDFKNEIKKGARQISGRIYYYDNFNITTENNNILLTENNMQIITEQTDFSNKILINDENIFSIDLIKNGQLLQSLAKECDFVSDFELNVGTYITPELGVLINNSYEYINYGDYIIYSKEYIAEKKAWKYTCYDKMLFSMIKYEPLNITYPITVDNYIKAIADVINLPFANYGQTYTNSSQTILKDVFESQNITYRDILDKLSEITASNILINKNNELELGYPNETNDTINEEYLSSNNVNFNAVVSPINKITIIDSDVDIKYTAEDTSSIETNGLSEITIKDNLLILNGNETTIANNILNKLNGLTYSLNDLNLTGICYYDYLDLFNIEIEGNETTCLLLNDETHITTGLKEKIFTNEYENSSQGDVKYETSNISNKTVQFKINQQEGKIESKVEKDGVISAINQSAEEVQIDANKISLIGKEIDLTSDNINIASTNFNVDSNGNMSCTNANVTGAITSSNATITGGSIKIDTSRWTQGIDIVNSQDNEEVIIRGGSLQFGLSNVFLIEMSSNYFNQGGYMAIKSLNNGYLTVENNVLNFYNSSGNREVFINGNTGDIQTYGSLYVNGTKNRVVKIKNNKQVLLNAYETATPYFGDIGSNKTDKNGYCKIEIENIFSQTIENDDYKVFIQECGEGKLYVEKHNKYFEVKGTPNIDFDWEIKAVQKGYKDVRLLERESDK